MPFEELKKNITDGFECLRKHPEQGTEEQYEYNTLPLSLSTAIKECKSVSKVTSSV